MCINSISNASKYIQITEGVWQKINLECTDLDIKLYNLEYHCWKAQQPDFLDFLKLVT